MNRKELNSDLLRIPTEIEIPVFLIAEDLKLRKFFNTLCEVGFDHTYCQPDLADVILALAGFDDVSDKLYTFYYDLVDEYYKDVNVDNDMPITEAFKIYSALMSQKNKSLNT